MTTPNYRALCAELTEQLAAETRLHPGHERDVVTRARAALAKPEPPADGEVAQLVTWLRSLEDASVWFEEGTIEAKRLSRAAFLLSRLAPQPVPEGPSDGPAVPESREPAAVMEEPSDAEITAWAEANCWGRPNDWNECCAFARAVLARWGRP